MRTLLLSWSLLACLAAAAASAQDAGWTGAYGGLSMATNSGQHDYENGGLLLDLEGPSFSGFGGYTWGNGNLFYGIEGAVALGGVYEYDDATSYNNRYEYDRFVDLKGRVGYSVNNFLLYGTIGVSSARFRASIGGAPGQVDTNTTGMLFGLGADYKFGDRYFAGGEIVRRSYSFYEAYQGFDIDSDINTFTLRFGMTF